MKPDEIRERAGVANNVRDVLAAAGYAEHIEVGWELKLPDELLIFPTGDRAKGLPVPMDEDVLDNSLILAEMVTGRPPYAQFESPE